MHYFDDTFVLFEIRFDISIALQTAYYIDPYNQFSFELENCNEFPFLDA